MIYLRTDDREVFSRSLKAVRGEIERAERWRVWGAAGGEEEEKKNYV